MDFELKGDYIELIKLLKVTGIAETGGIAKMMVENNEVLYNGNSEERKRLKVKRGDQIKVGEIEITII